MSAQIFFIPCDVNMFYCRDVTVFARPCKNVTNVLLSVPLVTFLISETHLTPRIWSEALCTCETNTSRNLHLLRTFIKGQGF